jgi:hypothetical protein
VNKEERESKAIRTSLFVADCAKLFWKLPAAWLATQQSTKTKTNDQTNNFPDKSQRNSLSGVSRRQPHGNSDSLLSKPQQLGPFDRGR